MKYRRIIAGLLTVNIIASSILTGGVSVNAAGIANATKNAVSATNEKTISSDTVSGENKTNTADTDKKNVNDSAKDHTDKDTSTGKESAADTSDTSTDTKEDTNGSSTNDTDSSKITDTAEDPATDQTKDADIEDKTTKDQNQKSESVTSETEETESSVAEEENADEEQQVQVMSADVTLDQLNFYDSNKKTATIADPKQLILLSNCDQDEVKDITIHITATGDFDLTTVIKQNEDISSYIKTNSSTGIGQSGTAGTATGSQILAGRDYTYQGIGNESAPFRGTLSGQQPSVKANDTIFGGISSTAKVTTSLTVTWGGDGKKPMFANYYVFEDTSIHSIPMKFTSGNGSIIGTVKAVDGFENGRLRIANEISYADSVTVGDANGSDNAGLICHTLESGYIELEGYTFPTKVSISANSGAAGALIGKIDKGTLEISNITNTTFSNLTVKSSSGCAGSIVGEMSEAAAIENNIAITVNSPSVTGKTAGGFVGKLTNTVNSGIAYSGNEKITVSAPILSSGTNTGANVGGFAGEYTAKATDGAEMQLPEKIVIEAPKVTTKGGVSQNGGNAGGYFGLLNLEGKITYKISGNSATDLKKIEAEYTSGTGESYGAIAGKVSSDNIASTLKIENISINSTNNNTANYHGGIIGELGTETKPVYMQVKNIKVTVSDAGANKGDYGFGGIVGRLLQNSIADISDVTIVLASGKSIEGGGGLVGCTESGSVVRLSGKTDLSDVRYSQSVNVGQLVGKQDRSLVYAQGDGNGNGWTYIRSNFSGGSRYVNDIGTYGQIIRLKENSNSVSGLNDDLITINEQHQVILNKGVSLNWSGTVTISSVNDFALYAIAWNSHGYFSADTSITKDNWTSLQTKSITLNTDIDLTGTGIMGLSRDNSDGKFTGSIDGAGHILTLAIGESFGVQAGNPAQAADDADGPEGCGKIYALQYAHNYLGLFSQAEECVTNLTIAGKINASNAMNAVSIGSIAGKVTCSSKSAKNVTISTKITVNAVSNNNTTCVGGFYGEAENGAGTQTNLSMLSKTIAEAEIVIKGSSVDGSRIFAGEVLGMQPTGYFKLVSQGLTVGGSIKTEASTYAYAGGLIGMIKPNESGSTNHWMEIKGLTFNGFTLSAPNASKSGGLFGGIWATAGVYFMGASDENDGTNIKVSVKSATINAPKASVGGLVYRASGIWEIRSYGIAVNKFDITAKKDIGLLVCRGESGQEKVEGASKSYGALYLRTTKAWADSYSFDDNAVTIAGTDGTGVYDEFVAYTAASADAISANGVNGVVSLRTSDNSSGCVTYVNRTAYGNLHNTNGCSRYYYNLDTYVKNVASRQDTNNNTKIDTPEELMLWSLYRYAAGNIKNYFCQTNDGKNASTDIKGSTTISGQLDMKVYSYYPVRLSSGISIENAEITFYNQEIENTETTYKNKSTQLKNNGTSSVQTQHYMMHCGLFLDYTAGGVSEDTALRNINVKNVTFAGSIGKIDADHAGVLLSGNVNGTESNGKQYIVKLKFDTVTFDGLKITGYTQSEYAPLLMNQIGSYTNTEVTGVKTNGYTPGTAVASSLIGNVGASNGKQINMSFSNIILPDKKAGTEDGIFTHATLLESYVFAQNDTSVATYNFYKNGDWNGDTYNHQVTYGKEISDSSEYKDLQKWYYDKDGYGEERGEVVAKNGETTTKDFSAWLPYVAVSYDESKNTHEIKVNQRVYDIVNGCGTYGDPYVITDEKELKILSEYMSAKTSIPRMDWKITIAKEQQTYCTNHQNDITFQYNGTSWVEVVKQEGSTENWIKKENGETRSNEFMQLYMANAYYDLQGAPGTGTDTTPKLELTDFKGLGSAVNPFRGVLTSSTKATIIMSGAGTGNGLIPYSYGSVVRNLTIQYQGTGKILTYEKASSTYYPGSCFGGVIGCILGGDNIIDGVKVTLSENWLTLSGDNKHLLQVGGYVGSVCGGGVVFRNMSEPSGLTNRMISGGDVNETAYSSLYVNPYIGRVLDGYAFADGVAISNTDKNYQIRNLRTISKESLTAAGKTVTIGNADGLLVLSAIINSGAASSGKSNAYYGEQKKLNTEPTYNFGNGEYGKVRNALYADIGKSTKPDDFNASVKDDTAVPGTNNAPYLVTNYGTSDLFTLAVTSGTTGGAVLNFQNNATLDMSVYGSSYQGISARYAVNAVTSGTGTSAAGIVPLISGVNGNGSQITLDTNVKEYADDDFHAASVGGLLNLFSPAATGTVSDLTFTGKASEKGVVLQYYNKDGKTTDTASANWQYKSNVGVGSFAGSSSGALASSWYNAGVTFSNVTFENTTVKGPAVAGGLIGNLGRRAPTEKANNATAEGTGILIQPYAGEQTVYVSCTYKNCSYDSLNVIGQEAAGGFCAYVYGKVSVLVTTLSVTDQMLYVGRNSEIQALQSGSVAGGMFGYIRRNISLNRDTGNQTAKWQNVNVQAGQCAGGIIGRIDADSGAYYINNILFEGTENKQAEVKGTASGDIYAGGIVGRATGSTKDNIISNCNVKKARIVITTDINSMDRDSTNSKNKRNGGIAGQTDEGVTKVKSCEVESTDIISTLSGGIIGSANVDTICTDCSVVGGNDKNTIKSRKSAAGIIGEIASGVKISIHDSVVKNMSIETIDDWGSGGLIGDINWDVIPSIYFYDSGIENCRIMGQRAGGLAGDVRGRLNGSNIRLKDTEISATNVNNAGLLIGLTGNRNLRPMCIAGISIQNSTATEGNKKITKLYGSTNDDDAKVRKQSYFSFSDYDGTASTAASGKKLLNNTQEVFPYVVTSPVSELELWSGTNATDDAAYYPYGDSVAWKKSDSGYTVNAKKIFDESSTVSTDGKYTYQETGVGSFNFSTSISTYNDNQENKVATDVNFPVLQVTDNANDTITKYLDILTNGGFTRANQITDDSAASPHVDAKVSTYVYNTDKKRFVLAGATSDEPSLTVEKNANGRISAFTTTTAYDNTKNRFTLLTVIFTEKDESGNAHTQSVYIPIIVRRMFEIDFTATLSAGTNYLASSYDAIEDKAHLLESTGNAFTAYLTYTYNSDSGVYSEYGWDSYIKAGGNVADDMNRKIRFNGSGLPKGTQLTLIDCRNDDHVYYYTVDGTEKDSSGSNSKVAFTAFKDASDNSYQSDSIGELMGVSVTEDSANGTFIEVDVNGKPVSAGDTDTSTTYKAPTVRVKEGGTYKYYRLKQSGEQGATYTVNVNESALKDITKKSKVSQNYYLVITVPSMDENENLNGSIQTELASDIPYQIHYRTRKGKAEDLHNSTASTYQISQGYQQSLKENVSGYAVKKLNTEDSVLRVDVIDEISIPSTQDFQEQDELYQKFSGSLINTLTKGTSLITSSELFPNGTSGTAEFYVYTESGTSKTYYSYANGAWTSAGNQETKALSYSWSASNGMMDLPLSTDGTIEHAVSLKAIRNTAVSANRTKFYVEVKMNATLTTRGLEVIPESTLTNGEPEEYTKLSYMSQLATSAKGLSYSTARASLKNTQVKYYRDEPIGAKLTYEADQISQLGINLTDLQYLDTAGEHAIIDTTAKYDMSAIKDLESKLSTSNGVQFRLELQQKKTTGTDAEVYGDALALADYINVNVQSENSGSVSLTRDNKAYTWTVPKNVYWDETNKRIKTGAIFDGESLVQAIQLKVDIKNVEALKHVYANYRVVLIAEILDNSDKAIDNTNASDNIIYTQAKISTDFMN